MSNSYDIFFVSYRESNAKENWEQLVGLVPYPRRIHGVEGLGRCYLYAAELSTTEHFFTVDGDNWVREEMNWWKIDNFKGNEDKIHVWRCKNPVNGLIYGHGGVKLWPKELLLAAKDQWHRGVDFTTDMGQILGGYYIQGIVASETRFNASPLEAWRGAFRECAKLTSGGIKNADPRSEERYRIWTTKGEQAPFGSYAIAGAKDGYNFALSSDSKEVFSKINDFAYLETRFSLSFPRRSANVQD